MPRKHNCPPTFNKGPGSLGRPKATHVRNHWITFRITAEEHVLLIDKAKRSGMTAGEYARSRALRGIVRTKKPATTSAIFGEDTRAVFNELRKQGVNLNQLARHCNQHQVLPPPEMTALARVMTQLWERLLAS